MHVWAFRLSCETPAPRERKRTKMRAEEGKKAQNFGPPTLWGPTLRGPTLRCQAEKNGKALENGRRRKERTYPELAGEGGRARLVVLGAEVGVGGPRRQRSSCQHWLWAKVRDLPEELQQEGRKAWLRRWQRLLGCIAAKAFMSLLGLVPGGGQSLQCTRSFMRQSMPE